MKVETQKNVSEEIATKKEDFGFVGYRDYKSSEFFKRYEEARKRIPTDVIAEVKDGVAPKKPVAKRKGHAIAIAVFGILYLALCVVGYFVHSEDIIIGGILAKNIGMRDGSETVQLYIRDLQDPDGPLKSLRAFQRVNVKAGETVIVELHLTDKSFEFWDPATNTMRIKKGKYEILVGTSSLDKDNKRLTVSI